MSFFQKHVIPRRTHTVRTVLLLALFVSSWTLHSTLSTADQRVAELWSNRAERAHDLQEVRSSEPRQEPAFSRAIEERERLLTQEITVSFVDADAVIETWEFALKDHPLWIVFDEEQYGRPTAVISEKRVLEYIVTEEPFTIPRATDCTVLSEWDDEYGVIRAQTSCIATDGYDMDTRHFVQTLRASIEQGKEHLAYTLLPVDGVLRTADGAVLHLLSTGKSDFTGSGLGRKHNVRKALNEHVNNVVIPAGDTFSFNRTLGPSVSRRSGWEMAYVIFNGEDLIPAPGGGICQASTTTYRAALRAGLPIVGHKSHSLYVTYYEKHGVGQDATIYPGQQDLLFENDTGAPLIVQSYNDGNEALVKIYGRDDGRTVTLSGPFFASTAPDHKHIRWNEILWNRTIKKPGAVETSEDFVARYKTMPRSLSTRVTSTTEYTRGGPSLHASAD